MVVSNPNKKKGEVHSSFFKKLLGFFYKRTTTIISVWLFLVVVSSFIYSFTKELEVYKDLRLTLNPIEIIFIGFINAIFMVVNFFIPFLIASVLLKRIMIYKSGFKIKSYFTKDFKIKMLISFIISLLFSIIFYMDILTITKTSPQLIKSSVEIFFLSFVSILLTITSMYGVLKGFKPVIENNTK